MKMFSEIGPYYENQYSGVRRRFRVPKDGLVIPSRIWIGGRNKSKEHITLDILRLDDPEARLSRHSLRIGTVYLIENMPPTLISFNPAMNYGGLQVLLKTVQKYEIVPERIYVQEYLTSLKNLYETPKQ